ncbi:cytochrome P450 [Myxococcus sp. AM009]|uniref:cytochrome P450 n=1 Tax=unclassified Myxococcus TaxID=2648731 RepID=UPI001595476B|nr:MULTISPECIES: cytochrome P450 [unclassified Myxococcus]NVJ00592.1 cytochrome P450 [Myxococcus sp. AM009]NVJ18331.1 cytochrome P450 [Myxococcus sp. AM010]
MSEAQKLHVNILAPEFHINPYPFYKQLREQEPVYWSEETRHWLITRHEDVQTALRDAARFSSQSSETFVVRDDFMQHLRPIITHFSMWAVMKDNPEHKRLRGLINQAFRPENVRDIHQRARQTAEWLIDQVHDKGEMDFVNDYAYALPALLFAVEILGMDRGDLPTFKQWSVDLAHATGRIDNLDIMLKGQDALLGMTDYITRAINDRLARPREDFISYLVKAWREENKLTLEEVVAQMVLLLAGGHTTTQNVISTGLLAVFKHPEQWERLKRDPVINRAAAEELYRFTSPAQAPTRVAACDFEFGGKQILKGQGVMPMVAAANRDPAVFDQPDTLDLSREKNPHLGFGTGIHVCPGAFLARAEIPVAFETLFRRIPNVRPKSAAEDWNMNLSFRGLSTFPICWS